MQKRLKKLSLQAGHDSMIFCARPRFVFNADTCSSTQHTSISFHFGPHKSTISLRRASEGGAARPLSEHGRPGPKKPLASHCPLTAHRPASCLKVAVSAEEKEGSIATPASRSDENRIIAKMGIKMLNRWKGRRRSMISLVREHCRGQV